MRLARARQALLQRRSEDIVTDIALSNGFAQFGRFAAEYRRRFGELPSRTMQRRQEQTGHGRWRSRRSHAPDVPCPPFCVCGGAKTMQCGAGKTRPPLRNWRQPTGLPKAVAAWCWGQRASHQFSSTPDRDRGLCRCGWLSFLPARTKRCFDAHFEQRCAGAGASSRGSRPAS